MISSGIMLEEMLYVELSGCVHTLGTSLCGTTDKMCGVWSPLISDRRDGVTAVTQGSYSLVSLFYGAICLPMRCIARAIPRARYPRGLAAHLSTRNLPVLRFDGSQSKHMDHSIRYLWHDIYELFMAIQHSLRKGQLCTFQETFFNWFRHSSNLQIIFTIISKNNKINDFLIFF